VETLLARFLGVGEGVWRRLPVGGTVGEVGVCACVVLSYGAVAGGQFARGGLWLYKPVPVSPLRALGLGVRGDGGGAGAGSGCICIGGEVVEEWRGVLNTSC